MNSSAQSEDLHELGEGSVFADKYLIERVLGAGGYARVYLATETGLERPVAVKVLMPEAYAKNSGFEVVRERFFREARFLAQLKGPHTVHLYDYDECGERLLYMALEFVDGEDLKAALEAGGPMRPSRAVAITRQILEGLREVHALGILHRDLKPNNVMLCDRFDHTEQVKLVDFGIAKSMHGLQSDLTQENAVIGTPRYLSPEQISGEELTPASDLYSVGLLFYEMLLGSSPHADTDLLAVFNMMQRLPEELEAVDALGDSIRSVLKEFLANDSSARVQSADDALVLLDTIPAEELSGSAVSSENPDADLEATQVHSGRGEVSSDAKFPELDEPPHLPDVRGTETTQTSHSSIRVGRGIWAAILILTGIAGGIWIFVETPWLEEIGSTSNVANQESSSPELVETQQDQEQPAKSGVRNAVVHAREGVQDAASSAAGQQAEANRRSDSTHPKTARVERVPRERSAPATERKRADSNSPSKAVEARNEQDTRSSSPKKSARKGRDQDEHSEPDHQPDAKEVEPSPGFVIEPVE